MKMKDAEGLFSVSHEKFVTDRYCYGSTIVKAKSKEEAMEKLNEFLKTEPYGFYTGLPCESVDFVKPLRILE